MPRSAFLPISLAGYFSKPIRIRRGLLATSGYQTMLSFSKVRQLRLRLHSLFLTAFPDVCGKLEGESIVQASIQDVSKLWYLEEPPSPLSPLSPTSLSTSPISPLSTVTASSINSAASDTFQDWRQPIRQGITLDTNICIRAVPPSLSSPSPSSPSSLPSGLQIPTRAPSQIHRSARVTVVPRRSSVSRSSPIVPVPPSPNALPRPHQPPMAAVPLTNQAMLASAASVAPTLNGVSQGGIAGGEAPKTPDSGVSMSPLTVTFTPPLGVTGPHKLQIGVCRNTSGQADICVPAIKETAILASLASNLEAAGPPSRKRGMQLFQSSVWQFWNRVSNKVS
jgi:hypothetical protein